MPFDGSPVIQGPKDCAGTNPDLVDFVKKTRPVRLDERRGMLATDMSRRPESVGSTLAVLGRARDLIAVEHSWCQLAFARTWFGIPVRLRSGIARRYCALGAIMRAGYELRVRIEDACAALEWQTGSDVQRWNDEPARTHAEVIAALDAALLAVQMPA